MPISAIPGLKNRGAIGVCCLAKMRTCEIYKIYYNDGGNIGPLAIFEVKIENIRNILCMMGNDSKLKLTFTLYLWAVVGKRMTRR